jgi:hypothetical protein
MGKSKATSTGKEKEKGWFTKRQEKEAKTEERKANASRAHSLESLYAYVDENGNLSSTPPGAKEQKEIGPDNIQLGRCV